MGKFSQKNSNATSKSTTRQNYELVTYFFDENATFSLNSSGKFITSASTEQAAVNILTCILTQYALTVCYRNLHLLLRPTH